MTHCQPIVTYCKPINILSKVYERLIYNQIHPYFDERFSKLQCDFCKNFDDQHCLISLKEKWQIFVDGIGETGTHLTILVLTNL